MNSNELDHAQNTIENLVCELIKNPQKKFGLIKKYLAVLEDLDNKRRIEWNREKFEVYEEISSDFTSDDIPF